MHNIVIPNDVKLDQSGIMEIIRYQDSPELLPKDLLYSTRSRGASEIGTPHPTETALHFGILIAYNYLDISVILFVKNNVLLF